MSILERQVILHNIIHEKDGRKRERPLPKQIRRLLYVDSEQVWHARLQAREHAAGSKDPVDQEHERMWLQARRLHAKCVVPQCRRSRDVPHGRHASRPRIFVGVLSQFAAGRVRHTSKRSSSCFGTCKRLRHSAFISPTLVMARWLATQIGYSDGLGGRHRDIETRQRIRVRTRCDCIIWRSKKQEARGKKQRTVALSSTESRNIAAW